MKHFLQKLRKTCKFFDFFKAIFRQKPFSDYPLSLSLSLSLFLSLSLWMSDMAFFRFSLGLFITILKKTTTLFFTKNYTNLKKNIVFFSEYGQKNLRFMHSNWLFLFFLLERFDCLNRSEVNVIF